MHGLYVAPFILLIRIDLKHIQIMPQKCKGLKYYYYIDVCGKIHYTSY